MPKIDLAGQVFERITVVSFSHMKQGHTYWNCRCSCGNEKVINTNRLRSGVTKSCGCLAKEKARQTCLSRATHGQSGRKGRTKLYNIWANMISRTSNESRKDSKWYIDKGISVCSEWRSFDGFLSDMGIDYKPGLSLDRIDNSKGYFRGNCRWILLERQNRNKTSNRILTIDGVDMCMAEAAEVYGINYGTLRSRIYMLGMDHKEAVTKPVKKRKSND